MTATPIIPLIPPNPDTPPCPDWCDLHAHHDWDSVGPHDRNQRGHGFQFSELVGIYAIEFEDDPGVLVDLIISVSNDVEKYVTTPGAARALVGDLERAIAWMEARG